MERPSSHSIEFALLKKNKINACSFLEELMQKVIEEGEELVACKMVGGFGVRRGGLNVNLTLRVQQIWSFGQLRFLSSERAKNVKT